MEYIDGPNCYIYCNQNPWSKFDPEGLDNEDISWIRANGWVGYTAYTTNPGTDAQQRAWADRAGVAATAVTAGSVSAAGVAVAEYATGIPLSLKDIPRGIRSLAKSAKNFFSKSSQAIGAEKKLVNAVNAAKESEGPSVFRYVSADEAETAARTGSIPNTNKKGELKEVFVTPDRIGSASEAESSLQIGKQNPKGIEPTPTHVIEGDATGVPFKRAGRVENGNAVELVTDSKVPVKKIEKLEK